MNSQRNLFLVELSDGTKLIVGNNYKPWWQHALEYIYLKRTPDRDRLQYESVQNLLVKVSYSEGPFYDDGGLKWCHYDEYQKVIDSECDRAELPRVKLADIKFIESDYFKRKLNAHLSSI